MGTSRAGPGANAGFASPGFPHIDPTTPMVKVAAHEQLRTLQLQTGRPITGYNLGTGKPGRKPWSWRNLGLGRATSNTPRNAPTISSSESDWCSEITLTDDREGKGMNGWKEKYWKAKEKEQEFVHSQETQRTAQSPVTTPLNLPNNRTSAVDVDDDVCLFAYHSESNRSTPGGIQIAQLRNSSPALRNAKQILAGITSKLNHHSSQSQEPGYGFERGTTLTLKPAFGSEQPERGNGYALDYPGAPPKHQGSGLSRDGLRQSPSSPIYGLYGDVSDTFVSASASGPSTTAGSPMADSDSEDRDTDATPTKSTGAPHNPFVSPSKSCPTFSVVYEKPPPGLNLSASPPLSSTSGLLGAGSDAGMSPSVSAVSSIGSRMYDIHVGAVATATASATSASSNSSPTPSLGTTNGRNQMLTTGARMTPASRAQVADDPHILFLV